MSIEFGILRPGSETTLMGEYRVDLDEDEFARLTPLVQIIRERTGIEVDLYGQATFDGDEVQAVVECIADAQAAGGMDPDLLARLHVVADEAARQRVSLEFRGL